MRTFLLLAITTGLAFSAPAWKSELSAPTPGSHPKITPCTLDFTLSWKGMLKAGSLRIDFAPAGEKKPGSFVTKTTASSQGAAAALYPMNLNYWSETDPASLRPKFFFATEVDGQEQVVTTNRYSAGAVSVKEVSMDLRSKAVKTEAYPFPFGPAHDMFSAILFLRSQKLDPGDTYTLLLLPFKSPYLLNVKVEAKEKHMGRDAIRLSFSMRKIDRKTHALGPYKKLNKPVILWMSDDTDRIPLELRAAVYIGDVRAVLTKSP